MSTTFCGRLDASVVSSYSGTIVYYSAWLVQTRERQSSANMEDWPLGCAARLDEQGVAFSALAAWVRKKLRSKKQIAPQLSSAYAACRTASTSLECETDDKPFEQSPSLVFVRAISELCVLLCF